jgi:alpha-galactosidase
MTTASHSIVHLRSGGVSIAYDLGHRVPRVAHWGADLGPLDDADLATLAMTSGPARFNSSLDTARAFSVLPSEYEGWSGTPGLAGHLDGTATTPRLALTGHHVRSDSAGTTITMTLRDSVAPLEIEIIHLLDIDGLLHATTRVRHVADANDERPAYWLQAVNAVLPVPARAAEILDFTGKWCRERSPQRLPRVHGTHSRQVRRGRPGHDSPFLMAVATRDLAFRRGEVWSMHVAWSGDQQWFVEQLPEGAGAHAGVLGGGELLAPGEIRLEPGESYTSPRVIFAWSGAGLDGVTDRFHSALRRRPSHPRTPRPLTLNSWEAVYFDHDLDRLVALTDRAARVGVERVVLDDGWFGGRRNDRAGLGDWTVSPDVWPDGLHPLVDRIREHGMQFGLWFEPEMVNLDSELARLHPDWLLLPQGELGPSWRHQYVLNVAHPDAWRYLFEQIDALVREYAIDFIKWDHNRDLLEAVWRHPNGDRPAVHEQTEALYRLLDELRERHPGLEIESCASGGARVDLGILERTDRVWASDSNDPAERQNIQLWTSTLLPLELIGSHVGAAESHTTHRVTSLSFRLVTALFAHAGIEWDITKCSEDELRTMTAWAGLYKEQRGLLHSGRVVRADLDDPAVLLHGVVATDGRSALFAWARLATSPSVHSGRVALPGLDPVARYRIRVREECGPTSLHQGAGPDWFERARKGWLELPGSVLATAGIPLPTLNPDQALVFEVNRID